MVAWARLAVRFAFRISERACGIRFFFAALDSGRRLPYVLIGKLAAVRAAG